MTLADVAILAVILLLLLSAIGRHQKRLEQVDRTIDKMIETDKALVEALQILRERTTDGR